MKNVIIYFQFLEKVSGLFLQRKSFPILSSGLTSLAVSAYKGTRGDGQKPSTNTNEDFEEDS